MTDKKNVLFLSVPNVSLLAKRTNNIINSGGIAVAGGLEFSGFNVDQYDLNAKLNTYRKKIDNFEIYEEQLKQRLDPSVTIMQGINSQIKKTQKKVVFADGEDENNLKAAIAFKNTGLGIPILLAKAEKIKAEIDADLSGDLKEKFKELDDFIRKHRDDLNSQMVSENYGWLNDSSEACA